MNFDDTPEEAKFRAEARAWIDANAPKELYEELAGQGFGGSAKGRTAGGESGGSALGYRGAQGRMVRWRRLFRSDHLAGLTVQDAQRLGHVLDGQAMALAGRTQQRAHGAVALRRIAGGGHRAFVCLYRRFVAHQPRPSDRPAGGGGPGGVVGRFSRPRNPDGRKPC